MKNAPAKTRAMLRRRGFSITFVEEFGAYINKYREPVVVAIAKNGLVNGELRDYSIR
jgi:hypothetical protein